jgi:dCMP deaminase
VDRIPFPKYYMELAKTVSLRSNCVRRQVGAVIVRENRVISTGYNGTPRNIKNCNEGGCARCAETTDVHSGTNLDVCICCHAEENSIVQAAYHGISTKGAAIYTMLSPCITCSKLIINSGIAAVVFDQEYPQTSYDLLLAAGVEVHRIDSAGYTTNWDGSLNVAGVFRQIFGVGPSAKNPSNE